PHVLIVALGPQPLVTLLRVLAAQYLVRSLSHDQSLSASIFRHNPVTHRTGRQALPSCAGAAMRGVALPRTYCYRKFSVTESTCDTAAGPWQGWERLMPEIHITRVYPYSPEHLWRAVTDPLLVPLWTSTGRGRTPEGFSPEVGNRFRFVGKPVPGWDGIVNCE